MNWSNQNEGGDFKLFFKLLFLCPWKTLTTYHMFSQPKLSSLQVELHLNDYDAHDMRNRLPQRVTELRSRELGLSSYIMVFVEESHFGFT